MKTIFDDACVVCNNLSLAIEQIIPSANYCGDTFYFTKESYDAIEWYDDRQKPSWNEVKNTNLEQYYLLRKSLFTYRLLEANLLTDFINELSEEEKFVFHSMPMIESDHPFAKRLLEKVLKIGGTTAIFARDNGEFSNAEMSSCERKEGLAFEYK